MTIAQAKTLMTIGEAETLDSTGPANALGKIASRFSKARKTHDFTRYECNSDYAFDLLEDGRQGYMSGQGRGIKPGDYIVIKLKGFPERYEVKAIDYYASPPDMWTAWLIEAK